MGFSAFDHSSADIAPMADIHRPPGAISQGAFADKCVHCADCAAVCPTQAIQMDQDGLPVVTVAESCTNCGLCADICMHGCIQFTPETKSGFKQILAEECKLVCVE